MLIDDGSTENSSAIFEEYSQYAEFMIEYHYKENGGKHTALNYSHPYIKSDWVVILDSDDILTNDAVEAAVSYIEKYLKQFYSDEYIRNEHLVKWLRDETDKMLDNLNNIYNTSEHTIIAKPFENEIVKRSMNILINIIKSI